MPEGTAQSSLAPDAGSVTPPPCAWGQHCGAREECTPLLLLSHGLGQGLNTPGGSLARLLGQCSPPGGGGV
jgi:hypothetical protein